ncbi:MAG TPA: hypothetical protein VJA66_06565 [Thermoanaerobaculia bacterium]
MNLDWSERILLFPVRAAAVDTFLHDLKRKRSGDLNGLLTTLNDGSLCREALRYWLRREWVVVAPFSPLVALAGPSFTRDLTLHAFCGETECGPEDSATGVEEASASPVEEEASRE